MIDPGLKAKIDSMDYESMLHLWRFAKVGHPMFQGEAGDYFSKRMKGLRDGKSDADRVATSKRVGWGGGE